jgi:hypothetical protein
MTNNAPSSTSLAPTQQPTAPNKSTTPFPDLSKQNPILKIIVGIVAFVADTDVQHSAQSPVVAVDQKNIDPQQRYKRRSTQILLAILGCAILTVALFNSDGVSLLLWLVILALSFFIYFLPSIVGIARKHPQIAGIMLLDLLGGWSGIGWIAALIWSCITPQPASVTVAPVPPAPAQPLDQLKNLGDLLDRGLLTKEEFESQKQKILAS